MYNADTRPEVVSAKAAQLQAAQVAQLERSVIGAFQQLITYLDGKVTKAHIINPTSSVSTPDMVHVVKAIRELNTTTAQKNLDLSPVTELLSTIKAELEQIPKEGVETVTVSNFDSLNSHFASLESVIKDLKLISSPQITVEKPDLKPLQTSLLHVIGAIQALKFPEMPVTDLKGVEKRLEGLGEWHDLEVKELKDANKTLKQIADKPAGGSGSGGGGGPVFQDTTGKLVYPQLDASGNIKTVGGTGGGGDASAANQTTEIAKLTSIDGKDFATQATLALIKAKTDNIDVLLSTRTKPADAQHVIVDSGVTTGLTDTQLRASAVPVSLAAETTKVVGVTRTADGAGNLVTSTANALDINIKSGNPTTMTVTQGTGTNLHAVLDTGSTTAVTGTVATKETQPATSAVTSVANSVTNVTLLASNANRRMATIYNDDTAAALYVKLGATASTSSFTIKIAAGGYFELPLPCYTGIIDGIASVATGSARLTELT